MTAPDLPEADDDQPAPALLFDDAELPEAEAEVLADVACGPARTDAVPLDDARLQAWIAGIVDHDERALLGRYEAAL